MVTAETQKIFKERGLGIRNQFDSLEKVNKYIAENGNDLSHSVFCFNMIRIVDELEFLEGHSIYFNDSVFQGIVDLSEFKFENRVNFDYCTFLDKAVFNNTKFSYNEKAEDENSISNETYAFSFQHVTFKNGINLSKSIFSGSTSFLNCSFNGFANFYLTEFKKDANFTMAVFNDDFLYDDSPLKKKNILNCL